jgi:hypothetical protein
MVGIVRRVAADIFFGFADLGKIDHLVFWLEHLVHGCLHRFGLTPMEQMYHFP